MTNVYKVTTWIRRRKQEEKLTNKYIDNYVGVSGCTTHWTSVEGRSQAQVPPSKRWLKLKELFGEPPEEIQKILDEFHINKKQKSKSNDKFTRLAEIWKGWGTALKPASEHWILVQKQTSEVNIAANVVKLRTGALNIDGSRIKSTDLIRRTKNADFSKSPFFGNHTNATNRTLTYEPNPKGRFPSNFMHTSSKKDEFTMGDLINLDSKKKVSHF